MIASRTRRIAVITGDPSLPDPTKREASYHEEDELTHKAMMEAFQSLEGYGFEFWSAHEHLLDLLRDQRPDLVVNFCDTGFRNVPTQELNLPAYLELLGIPYTGAPPAAMVSATTRRSCAWSPNRSACRCPAKPTSRPTCRSRRCPTCCRR